MTIEIPTNEPTAPPPPPDTFESEFAGVRQQFATFAAGFLAAISGQLCVAIEVGKITVLRRSRAQTLDPEVAEGYAMSLELEPGRQTAELVLASLFAGWAADVLLGAPLAFAGRSREYLTDLDRRSIDILMESVPAELCRAFSAISSATPLPACEFSVRQIPDHPPSAVVLRAELVFGGSTSSLTLLLPDSLAAATRPESNTKEARARNQAELLSALASTMVDVDAVLKGSDMRLRDFVRLRPGMVLALPQTENAPVDCQINGVTKFRGEMTRAGASAALVIQSIVADCRREIRPLDQG